MSVKYRKKIYYRIAEFKGVEESLTLQSLLKEALKDGVQSRQQTLNSDEKTFRAINQWTEWKGMTCCQVIQVDPDAYQPVMIYGSGAPEEYQIDAVSTNELGREDLKRHSDFINSILYFVVKGNEVVVMQSTALTILSLERYLGWLLVDKKVIPETAEFSLIKQLTPNIEELLQKRNVKSVKIGSSIIGGNYLSSNNGNLVVKDEITVETQNLGTRILNGILSSVKDNWIDRISEESNLQAKLVISYSRKTDPVGRKLMNVIGNSLRNVDEGELTITLEGGEELKGEQINMIKVISVEKTNRGLYVTTDLYNEMASWLMEIHEKKE